MVPQRWVYKGVLTTHVGIYYESAFLEHLP